MSLSTNNPAPQASTPWHSKPAEEVLAALESSPSGLTGRAWEARKELFGPNQLPEGPKRTVLGRLLAQCNNLLIYVLLVAAGLAASVGHLVDAGVVLAVVVVNVVIGFIQEGRAESALEAIRRMIDPRASVLRDGHRQVIAAEDIVPGDLVLLEPGDRVPADLRLVKARNLRIDEAALTGESVPVDKSTQPVPAGAPLADRTSMAFSGTFIAAGTGTGVSVATGAESELGRISTLVGTVETLTTPLLRQMHVFARKLTTVILMVSIAVFAFAVFVRDYDWAEAFMVMIGLAVAAIPEGLPAVMTIALAIGVQRMAARNAIIRRLPAVETLGSVSVICSDKTGTLTRNEMTVRTVLTAAERFEISGVGYRPEGDFAIDGNAIDPAGHLALREAARAAILCNDADLCHSNGQWHVLGDPMEGALTSFGAKAGYDPDLLRKQLRRTDEIPFDTQHKFMATMHHSHEDGTSFAYIKGAPERILAMCGRQRGKDGDEPLDEAFWRDETEAIARQGQRVLAVARKDLPKDQQNLNFSDVESDATLLGLLGLIDPPREEALAAIQECQQAGIHVKMITGDHAATATAIAGELKLAPVPRALSGQDLDGLDDAALKDIVRDIAVFARTSPSHKLRLVTALQADGAVIAMTGDGVNDAPALKRADVGVAMGGKGTEAAKEAAEMILADDNFASIVAAVREGRTVYDNLRKCIMFLLPINGGESGAILVAVLLGLVLPISPLQILWVNMVSSVALALTLAFEPPEPNVMRRAPRSPREQLLSGYVIWRILFVSFIFLSGIFGMFAYALERGFSLEQSQTIAVNTLVVMEVFYLFSVRYVHGPSITWQGVFGTRAVLLGIAFVTVAQFTLTYLPFMHTVFGTAPVSFYDGLLIVAVGIAVLLLVELEKRVCARLTVATHARPDALQSEPSGR